MTGNTRSELVQRALRIAQRFKETVTPLCVDTSPRKPAKIIIPPLHLDIPREVETELANSTVHQLLRDILQREIIATQTEYRRIYDTTCQRAVASPIPQLYALEALSGLISKRFQLEVVPGLFKEYLSSKEEIARSIQAASTIPSTSSKPFNHAFIPILTAYFMWNAFPPAADKRILASKGLMTDRQIDVWFQNRRALARKHGVRLEKAAYKAKTKNGVPAELMKQITEFTSFSSPNHQQIRKDDEERQWRWSVGWGSLGLSGLWERGRIVAHSVLEKNKQDIKVKSVDVLAMPAPLEDFPQSMDEWVTLRKEGKVVFDYTWLKAPYAQRTTVVPSPAPPVPDPRPSEHGEVSLRRVTEMFADVGRIHFGLLGVRNEGEAGSDYGVGAATMGVTRDVRWYVSRIGSWNAPRSRPEVREVEVKAKKRKSPEKKEKKRLGERRQPTSRYEPYPGSSRSSSKSSLRSQGSSSSLSSSSSRTPSLTSAFSDEDDDMESLFGGGIQLDLEGFTPVGDGKGMVAPSAAMIAGPYIPMGMDMHGMGYGYSNLDLGMNYGGWGLLGDVF